MAARLTYTKSALNFKALLRKAEVSEIAVLAEAQKRMEEIACSNAVLWAENFAAAQTLLQGDKAAFADFRRSSFWQTLKTNFVSRMDALSKRVLVQIQGKCREGHAIYETSGLWARSSGARPSSDTFHIARYL